MKYKETSINSHKQDMGKCKISIFPSSGKGRNYFGELSTSMKAQPWWISASMKDQRVGGPVNGNL